MSGPSSISILSIEVRLERDIVFSRQRTRWVADGLGFGQQDQVRLATAVSELARNAFRYAGGGRVEFIVHPSAPQPSLEIAVRDHGSGIADLEAIMNGTYVSETGMGLGIIGVKRLMEEFHIDTGEQGTSVQIRKYLPESELPVTSGKIRELVDRLSKETYDDPFAEIQRQNRELLTLMSELEKRNRELSQLNQELEDTNRGVVALYAELDQRADVLRRISESKTRFLSNMTHEFRTPLNSILSLTRMLSDRLDGELSLEQSKQVSFIQKAAGDLSHLVDDLLDLAKIEAGKVTVRSEVVDIKNLFGALRGTLRPLISQNSSVLLVFDDVSTIPNFQSDEAKLSQILRNFISNALKFTAQGEVRVSAVLKSSGEIHFCVADTGIGIAPEDQERIFQEFEQVEGGHQGNIKGTGLGLPLARSLAELLGGTVQVESQLGSGSRFSLVLPAFPAKQSLPATGNPAEPIRVLLIDDDASARYVTSQFFLGISSVILEADTGFSGLEMAFNSRPHLIILDLGLPDISGREVLVELRARPESAAIPVLILTSSQLSEAEVAELMREAQGVFSKNPEGSSLRRETMPDLLLKLGMPL